MAPSASPSVLTVSGAYSYTVAPGSTRRDSVAARAGDPPDGTWSRTVPENERFLGGPITCLVVDGREAWLAGPVDEAAEGATGAAAFLYVRDAGEDGAGDLALTWIADPGQSLETMETWFRNRFIPADPYPLDDGDIEIRTGS